MKAEASQVGPRTYFQQNLKDWKIKGFQVMEDQMAGFRRKADLFFTSRIAVEGVFFRKARCESSYGLEATRTSLR